EAVCRYARAAQPLQGLLESPPGGRSARLLVDDVTAARLVHRAEHRHGQPPLSGVALHCLDQLPAGDCLVRDHEQPPQFLPTSSSSCCRAPFSSACRAPGTPYSYGPPTTCGISSKLKIGGGDDTCHSSVSARHGFPGASGPYRHE